MKFKIFSIQIESAMDIEESQEFLKIEAKILIIKKF